jgi:HK97 family phage portal protein
MGITSCTLVPMWGRLGSWARRTLGSFRASLRSISDPRLAELFSWGFPNYSGESVNESSALGISAVWRAVSLISGTLAMLPMRSIREIRPGEYQRTASFLDNPGGPDGPTPMEWRETVFAHLLLHGNAFLAHIYGGAGQLIGLSPLHPLAVNIELPSPDDEVQPKGGKWFYATLIDGSRERFDATTMTHVMGLSLDGIRGLSCIEVGRNSFGTAMAGDRAASSMFGQGLTVAGLVTPDEDEPDWEDAGAIKAEVNGALTGGENAGKVAVINRKLKFQQMQMSAEDAQFLQSRQFSIEEIARWFGVPPFELMQTEKQTSWGTGIEAQQRGLGRTVLAPWATRLEQRLSRLLPQPRFVEFDFSGLERPSPDVEIKLLLEETDGGLMTINEARAVRNLAPVPGGDILRIHGVPLQPEPEPEKTPAEQTEETPAPAQEETTDA